MSRKAALCLFVGTNGTGKSTQMRRFTKVNDRNLIIPANKLDKAFDSISELKSQQLDVVIRGKGKTPQELTVYPELNRFKGVRKVFCQDSLDLHGIIESPDVDPRRSFLKGGIFFDDFKNYVQSRGVFPSVFRRLFSDRRHREVDIFIAAHSWQYINPELFSFEPTCFVFKVTQPVTKQIQDKVQNIDELIEIQTRVNERSEKDPYYFEVFHPA